MYCHQCGTQNAAEAATCRQCGTSLNAELTIAKLQSKLADAQQRSINSERNIERMRRFVPSVIAQGLLQDQEQLRGERREVTVLFVDAVNFTQLSVSLDAESVFNLINDLLSRLVACIHRYGGIVDKFTGDGLMAVFGAPIAHENDAELALRSALDMQSAAKDFAPTARAQLGAPLEIRIGINSGLAVAGILGTEEQAAYTVIGESVNLAARLESSAKPGRIVVSANVHTRTHAFFDFSPKREISVKGVDHPITVYETVGLRTVAESPRGLPGTSEVYLGRDQERDILHRHADRLRKEQLGHLILIEGEAGMGKTRLVSECIKDLDDSSLTIWRGRGLPYDTQGTGYGIFRSLFQSAIDDLETGKDFLQDLAPSLRPFINRLMGRPLESDESQTISYLDPERINQLTTVAIREAILNTAHENPLFVILDDFHWADDLSRDLLQVLLPLVSDVPLILCVMTRPNPDFTLDTTGIDPEVRQRIELEPLSQKESRVLLSALVDIEAVTEATIQAILKQAEGNPFYIEEFVRMLVEKEILQLQDGQWRLVSTIEVEDLEIPTSLRGLMLARVDRLPEDLRYVLRDAAIIGPEFDAGLLQTVTQQLRDVENITPMLDRLSSLGLLTPRPRAGETPYAFRHILTQETIYQSILRNQRRELHQIVAQSIESRHKNNLEPFAEMLAFHYDRARVREKALRFNMMAGIQAQQRFANHEALQCFNRALQLSQQVGDTERERWQAAIALGDIEQHIGENEEAIACYEAALEEGQEASDEQRAEVYLRIARAWNKLGNFEQAEWSLRTSLETLERVHNPSLDIQAEVYSELGWLTFRSGDLPQAQERLEQAVALVDESQYYPILASTLNRLGAVYYSQGDWEKATSAVQRSLELRQRMGDILGVARSSNNLGILRRDSGDWAGALEDCKRSLEIMQQIGDIEGTAIAHTNIANVYIDLGNWDQAESNLLRSYEIAQEIANPYEKAQANMNLGRIYLLQERWDQAQQFLDRAIALFNQVGTRGNPNVADACGLQARLYLEQGELQCALTWAKRNYEQLQTGSGQETGESPEWGRYKQLEGRIKMAQNDLEEAIERFRQAITIFEINRSSAEVGRTTYWLARAYTQAGLPEEARNQLTDAQALFRQLGAQRELARTKEALAALEL
jgi:class 3 adenylate cyclase/predicted ATPase